MFSMFYMPGRELASLHIEVPVGAKIKDIVSVLEALAEHDVVMLRSLYHHEFVEGVRKAYICALCDFTESTTSIDEVVSKIRKMHNVKSVHVIKASPPGFIVDESHYPLVVVDERALVFRKEMMNMMLLGIREKWGATGQVFLYYLGYEGGIGAARFYKRVSNLPPAEAVKAALKVATAHGLGKFELITLNLEKPQIVVRVYDLFECIPVRGKRDTPFSEFYRGILCGTFSELLGMKLTAEEVKCIAKGDPYCEFVLTKEEEGEQAEVS